MQADPQLTDKDLRSIQEVRSKCEAAHAAALLFRAFSQEQVDAIVERIGEAARANAERLGAMAAEETGYGNAKDKLAKNLLAAELLVKRLRGVRTVGVLREITDEKIVEIAVPVGVVAAVLPTTNPTSTAIYKTLISVKAGNAIVMSPHPNAKACTCATAAVLAEAAEAAGAPAGLIQCLGEPTIEGTNAMMRHPRTSVILSTGGAGIVRAAYSSGKPAFGVGPGNVPVLIDGSADIAAAVAGVVAGKTFDYGTLCSSEQSVVAEESLREPITAALRNSGAYFCDAGQSDALARLLFTPQLTVNPKCVGQPAPRIAEMAGFSVPPTTPLLVTELAGIGRAHPLSAEKLSPVLSLHFVTSFAAALDACEAVLKFGGLGHTCGIYATDDARVREFGLRMPAFRVLVNTPTPQGSTGITTNLFPAMTLGCGAAAGNSTGDNVAPHHLFHVKRIAYMVRSAADAFDKPATSVPTTIDRAAVASAVERYLSNKGVGLATPPVAAVVAQVVDNFLNARPGPAPPPPAAGVAPPPPPAQPKPATVDFVCENDVRSAMNQSRKIHICRKTIVTPAARELGETHGVLVMT